MYTKLLTESFGDSILALGITDQIETIEDEIKNLIHEPINWYITHPNWPSATTKNGFPLELSLSISQNNTPNLRFLIDVTDHRNGLGNNWNRYLESSKCILNHSANKLDIWNLFVKHLDGVPPTWRTRVGVGSSYGVMGQRRSCLYFYARGFTNSELIKRFPEHIALINELNKKFVGLLPSNVDFISYDFNKGKIDKTKIYWRLNHNELVKKLFESENKLTDLISANKVFNKYFDNKKEKSLLPSAMLQMNIENELNITHYKFQFNCQVWGWVDTKSFCDFLVFINNTFNIDLSSLYLILGVYAEHKVQLIPSWFSIGPGDTPSVCFYFRPLIDKISDSFYIPNSHSKGSEIRKYANYYNYKGNIFEKHVELIDEMYKRAIDYIFKSRNKDGSWSDFPILSETMDEWVTAYISTSLSTDTLLQNELNSTAIWLQELINCKLMPNYTSNVKSDADTISMSLLALHRANNYLPIESLKLLEKYRLKSGGYKAYYDLDWDIENGNGAVEITASVLFTLIESGLFETESLCNTVNNILMQQRDEGGWNAFWWKDDIFATNRVVRSLNSFINLASSIEDKISPNLVSLVKQGINSARPSISAWALPDEAFAIGLWLDSWIFSNGSVGYPSIERIIYHLSLSQQDDGCWLSVPIRRIARTKLLRHWARADSGRIFTDTQCLVTTATVVKGLYSLRKSLLSVI